MNKSKKSIEDYKKNYNKMKNHVLKFTKIKENTSKEQTEILEKHILFFYFFKNYLVSNIIFQK